MKLLNKCLLCVLTFLFVLSLFGCGNDSQSKNEINQTFLSSDCYIEVIDILNTSCGDVTPYTADFDADAGIFAIHVTAMEGLGALVKANNAAIKSEWKNLHESLAGLGEAIEAYIKESGFDIEVSVCILSDDDSTMLFKSMNGKVYNIFETETQYSAQTTTKPSGNKGNATDLPAGTYWCMGKNDTCKNKTYDPYDLYCKSCDPDNDNVENSKSYSSSSSSSSSLSGGSYWCMGKNDTCKNKTYDPYDFYCKSCDPDNDNKEG